MSERVDVELLRLAAPKARCVGDALVEALHEAERAQADKSVVTGHLAAAEAALHATQEALWELLRGPKEEVLAKVAELPTRWDRMMTAFWRLQSSQRPWPTADGEFVEAMQQVKEVIDRVRGRFPVSAPSAPAPGASD